jgi:hypothetical protein
MPKKSEHGDVFLRVRMYEKCSFHNHKTLKQHPNQTNTSRAIPSVIKAIGSLWRCFAVEERNYPVKVSCVPVGCSCLLILFLFGVFLLEIPGPAAWSCLVLPGPAWFCLVRLGPSWSCLVTCPTPSWWFFFPRFNNVLRQTVAGWSNLVYLYFQVCYFKGFVWFLAGSCLRDLLGGYSEG